jgi:predicted phage terminase large subunit-like protein
MNSFDRSDLTRATRQYFTTFVDRTFQTVSPGIYRPNWHIDAMAYQLERCLRGEITRLVICASVALPAYALGRDPSKQIVCVSYSAELAAKHARDSRRVMDSKWYKRAFPNTIIAKDSEMHLVTTAQGHRFATSPGGTNTGMGGNLFIIDDPLNVEDAMSTLKRTAVNEWFDRTLLSRLNDKRNDGIIIVMQRVHLDDLTGHVLQKGRGRWTHLNLPAIADEAQTYEIGRDAAGNPLLYHRQIGDVLHPNLEPRAILDDLKAQMGSLYFSAQYQQSPLSPEDGLIKWSWFSRYETEPPQEQGDTILQSWDTAQKAGEINDYSACTTLLIKDNKYFVLDVFRKRLDYPSLRKQIVEHARRFHADTLLIEDKGSGTSLIQELRSEDNRGVPLPIAFTPESDKVTRMSAQSAKIEAGQVYLPPQASWLDDFRIEVLQFPHSAHDDQIDSLSQALTWLGQRQHSRFEVDWGDDLVELGLGGRYPLYRLK